MPTHYALRINFIVTAVVEAARYRKMLTGQPWSYHVFAVIFRMLALLYQRGGPRCACLVGPRAHNGAPRPRATVSRSRDQWNDTVSTREHYEIRMEHMSCSLCLAVQVTRKLGVTACN